MTNQTRLSLGTAQWGIPYGIANWTGVPDRPQVQEMLELALDSGVASLDTARDYGASEWLLGSLVGHHPGWRIVTKLAGDVGEWKLPVDDALVRTAQSIAQSRRALRRTRLDALLLHRSSHRSAYGGALWRHLRCERERGGIAALGVSAASPDEAIALLDDPEVELIQVATSLLDQRLWRAGFFQRARERGVRVHIRSIFLQGTAHLDPKSLPFHLRDCRDLLDRVDSFSRERGATVREAFLAFARAMPADEVIVGCDNIEHVRQLLGDWERAAISARDVLRLAADIPALDGEVLNPARWPQSPALAT